MREFVIQICDECINLKGDMCDEPECVFHRKTTREIGILLDMMLIRPVVNGKRIEVIGDEIIRWRKSE